MDYIFFIPPPPFFAGTRIEFADPSLEDCWYGRVELLYRIRVKLDKKDGDGRSVRMDCDCAMISVSTTLLSLLRAGVNALLAALGIFFGVHKVCIGYALCLHKVCNEC
jgi:hypothetical protein